MWRALQRSDSSTLAELAETTGLHVNTLREHLDQLSARGLVRRFREESRTRGRPAWRYAAIDTPDPALTAYRELASALAATIYHTSAAPRADALTAGRRWGRQLARRAETPDSAKTSDEMSDSAKASDGSPREVALRLLRDLGFEFTSDQTGREVRLTRCPLLDVALRYPEVVCAVHLGIVQGALQERQDETTDVALHPFAEPGACRLAFTEEDQR